MLRGFASDRDGSVLVETLIAVPVVTLFTIAVLETGNMFWQRQLFQTGVRDAARYMSRCRPVTLEFMATCRINIARDIAFYGKPNPGPDDPPRVRGWGRNPSEELVIRYIEASTVKLLEDPWVLDERERVSAEAAIEVEGKFSYRDSPLLNIGEAIANKYRSLAGQEEREIKISPLTITYTHTERYIGW
ncbi:TadE family protein [Phaeovulum sp. NW3]|uniref:TadE/TadG family type IV pilus assembly protein n=1 Tax=Phaeovulum sp. NW3 TaxID=2934933 RepID=UPI0020214AE4|nr:TadE family protein [Phaeovulum sp. NW3]MCL7464643.1 pilus assembly protein [Phaeovulum sp. NW3]